jgi:uncharacterized caspase-like protein
MKRALLVLCSLALLPVLARAEKFALLVGIDNYPDEGNQLRGCVEDVKSVERLLTGKLGYAPDKITTLTDAQATRSRIVESFRRELTARAQPGDEVFFYYSGHGSFIPDALSAEADGTEGVLCPYDTNDHQPAATLIADHQLRELLAALPTSRAIMVLDSCHSGNITTRGGISSKRLKAKYMRLGFDPADYNALPRRIRTRGGGSVTGAGLTTSGNPEHVILAACAADQSAYIDEPVGSVFTQAFVHVARSLKPERTTYGDLVKALGAEVETYMREHGDFRQQSPQAKGVLTQTVFLPNSPADRASAISSLGKGSGRATDDGMERVGAAQVPRTDFPLTVWPDKSTYRDGESMRIYVRADKDCYLRLYHRDVEGNVQLIFPNPWQQDNRVKAKQPVAVPDAKASFQFTAAAPFGSEIVIAVASTSQFADLEKVQWKPGEFIDYGAGPAAFAGIKTRGMKVGAARSDASPPSQFSEAEAIIRVMSR